MLRELTPLQCLNENPVFWSRSWFACSWHVTFAHIQSHVIWWPIWQVSPCLLASKVIKGCYSFQIPLQLVHLYNVKWYRCHWDFCRDFCYWEQNFEGLQNCSFEFWFFLEWTVHFRRPCKNGWTDREVLWHEDSGGPKEPYIWWVPGCPMRRGNFRGKDTPGHAQRHPAMNCAKMDELIEMSFGLWTRMGPRKHVLCGSPDPSMGRGNIEGEGDPL